MTVFPGWERELSELSFTLPNITTKKHASAGATTGLLRVNAALLIALEQSKRLLLRNDREYSHVSSS
jgi:hypothetical protein